MPTPETKKCTSATFTPVFEGDVKTTGEFGSQGVSEHQALSLQSAKELSEILANEGPKVKSVVVMAHPIQVGAASGANKAVPYLLFLDGPVVNEEKRTEFLRGKTSYQKVYDLLVRTAGVSETVAGTLVNAGLYAAEWTQGNGSDTALRDATTQYQGDRKDQGYNESNL
jgi:hypothetical protein